MRDELLNLFTHDRAFWSILAPADAPAIGFDVGLGELADVHFQLLFPNDAEALVWLDKAKEIDRHRNQLARGGLATTVQTLQAFRRGRVAGFTFQATAAEARILWGRFLGATAKPPSP